MTTRASRPRSKSLPRARRRGRRGQTTLKAHKPTRRAWLTIARRRPDRFATEWTPAVPWERRSLVDLAEAPHDKLRENIHDQRDDEQRHGHGEQGLEIEAPLGLIAEADVHDERRHRLDAAKGVQGEHGGLPGGN